MARPFLVPAPWERGAHRNDDAPRAKHHAPPRNSKPAPPTDKIATAQPQPAPAMTTSSTTSGPSWPHGTPAVFAAPWGRALRVMSTTISLLMLGIAAVGLLNPMPQGARLAMILSPALFLLGGWIFQVRGFTVLPEPPPRIEIQRPLWTTTLLLRDLQAIERDPTLLQHSLRVAGNGGFFSFTGWFWNRRLGRFRLFANDPALAVALRFPDRRVVLAPADPDRFIQAVRAAVPI